MCTSLGRRMLAPVAFAVASPAGTIRTNAEHEFSSQKHHSESLPTRGLGENSDVVLQHCRRAAVEVAFPEALHAVIVQAIILESNMRLGRCPIKRGIRLSSPSCSVDGSDARFVRGARQALTNVSKISSNEFNRSVDTTATQSVRSIKPILVPPSTASNLMKSAHGTAL